MEASKREKERLLLLSFFSVFVFGSSWNRIELNGIRIRIGIGIGIRIRILFFLLHFVFVDY